MGFPKSVSSHAIRIIYQHRAFQEYFRATFLQNISPQNFPSVSTLGFRRVSWHRAFAEYFYLRLPKIIRHWVSAKNFHFNFRLSATAEFSAYSADFSMIGLLQSFQHTVQSSPWWGYCRVFSIQCRVLYDWVTAEFLANRAEFSMLGLMQSFRHACRVLHDRATAKFPAYRAES
jgi:hypothetical protein